MATAKGQIIADYAISKIGCAYIWGGYGEKQCTTSFRKQRASQYPSQKTAIYNTCPVLSGKQSTCDGCRWQGKQAYDCAQLTRYCCKAGGQELVSGANSQWKKTVWDQKGTIDTLPDVPGVILYHITSKGVMSHTGVYIGNGYAVEARAAKYGVVKTAVKDRSWTHWAALPGVLTGEEVTKTEAPPKAEPATPTQTTQSGVISMMTLKNGHRGTQVKVLQWLLSQNGFDAGKIDGIFGANTKKAVKAYQEAHNLDPDGIVGRKTWKSLLE